VNVRLRNIAYARSGDKGSGANIGVIAHTAAGYQILLNVLTAERVREFFSRLGPGKVMRYELPNLLALNFVLPSALGDGGSLSLRIDAQGKALGQALLEMPMEMTEVELAECVPSPGAPGEG
jgi:hypothetical protein